MIDAGGPVGAAARRARADALRADARPAHPPPPRSRRRARRRARAPPRHAGADPRARARSRAGRHRDDAARASRSTAARSRSQPLHTPGHTAGMLSLLVNGTDVFTGDTLFKGSVGGVRAPGHTTYADLKSSIMDTLLKLPPETRIHPGHTDPTTVAEELEHNGSCGSGADSTPRAASRARRSASPATLILLGDDYDGGHKAWVRWPDGSDDIVPGLARRASRLERGGRRPVGGPDSIHAAVAKDKIPTSRVGRTAKIGGLAAGQAIRQAGTRAANVARTKERRDAALERRHIEAAEQIVAALGTMKGAAMKVGQVMSFLDVGLVPPGVPRGVPAQARRAARRRADGHVQGHAQGDRGGARRAARGGVRRVRRRSRSRPPRSARSTARSCTTAARSRSRSSTRASRPPCAPTCRTSG